MVVTPHINHRWSQLSWAQPVVEVISMENGVVRYTGLQCPLFSHHHQAWIQGLHFYSSFLISFLIDYSYYLKCTTIDLNVFVISFLNFYIITIKLFKHFFLIGQKNNCSNIIPPCGYLSFKSSSTSCKLQGIKTSSQSFPFPYCFVNLRISSSSFLDIVNWFISI